MNKKRTWGYIFFILLSFVLIVWKQHAVLYERDQVVLSSVGEWEKNGKPVVLYEVKKRDVPVNVKMTVSKTFEDIVEGYVSEDLRNKIKKGQEITFDIGNKKLTGAIAEISDEISFDTGMYKIQALFDDLTDLKGWVVAHVCVDYLKNAVCIPNEIVSKEDSKLFVWKIENEKAVKQEVDFKGRDGYGMEITKGLKEGDFVVVAGSSILLDGDKVNVLKKVSAKEMNDD